LVVRVSIGGFFTGVQCGATSVTTRFGEGVLRTVLSWVVGLLAGLTAALAERFYAAAVIMLAGLVG
jgi:hypothetical protein